MVDDETERDVSWAPEPARAAVLTWDYQEQPSTDALARVISELTGGWLRLHHIHTGSDQYGIVLTTAGLDDEGAHAVFRRWEEDDERPELLDLTAAEVPRG